MSVSIQKYDPRMIQAANIAYEFEFYTDLDATTIAQLLKKATKKKIVVCDKYHTDLETTAEIWKIEPDMSGGAAMLELITGPMKFLEALTMLSAVCAFISKNGWTDEKCGIHVNMSFDMKSLPIGYSPMNKISKLKLCLGIDEDLIYKQWPDRKGSMYARSMRAIYPLSKFAFNDNFENVNPEFYHIPDNKYYGLNLTKLQKNYIEVRYLGGANYEQKVARISPVISSIGSLVLSAMESDSFTVPETAELKKIITKHKKFVDSFSTLDRFLLSYTNMRLLVDLKGDYEIVKSFYSTIREKLFDLIVDCQVKRGTLNYDSDISVFQGKDMISKEGEIKNMELVNCKLSGDITKCTMYDCTINKSHILDSEFVSGNVANTCKIVSSPITTTANAFKNCYIDNKNFPIDGEIKGGVIKSGDISTQCEIAKDVIVVSKQVSGAGNKKV